MTRRRLATLFMTLVVVASAEVTVVACPVCFQVEDGAAAGGVRAAVLVLIGVTAAVLSGVGWFVRGMVRRTRAASTPEERR